MAILSFFPLFGFFYIGYFVLALVGIFPNELNHVVFEVNLPSGILWKPSLAVMVILFGLVALFIELFKSTRTSSVSIIDHILSTFVLVAFMVTWLIFEWAGNSTFLILTTMSFLDVIAGFTITIASARRDFSLGGNQ
ncbi:hypothetical protein [Leucothrix arctica]|uniref:Uncharacterized protein n=1 Tax=Leucothrix arctica TaxID=1481894 RepID=A0A317C8L1_9GAMM|nr:hypothetical protein [Leucothrix arctica]PWQ94669.1 hypothetical protein DKT75_15360 [Leucothrix arctica]